MARWADRCRRAEEDAEYNKALIVATHNALPAILTALRAAEAAERVLWLAGPLENPAWWSKPLCPDPNLAEEWMAAKSALHSALAALGEGPQNLVK